MAHEQVVPPPELEHGNDGISRPTAPTQSRSINLAGVLARLCGEDEGGGIGMVILCVREQAKEDPRCATTWKRAYNPQERAAGRGTVLQAPWGRARNAPILLPVVSVSPRERTHFASACACLSVALAHPDAMPARQCLDDDPQDQQEYLLPSSAWFRIASLDPRRRYT